MDWNEHDTIEQFATRKEIKSKGWCGYLAVLEFFGNDDASNKQLLEKVCKFTSEYNKQIEWPMETTYEIQSTKEKLGKLKEHLSKCKNLNSRLEQHLWIGVYDFWVFAAYLRKTVVVYCPATEDERLTRNKGNQQIKLPKKTIIYKYNEDGDSITAMKFEEKYKVPPESEKKRTICVYLDTRHYWHLKLKCCGDDPLLLLADTAVTQDAATESVESLMATIKDCESKIIKYLSSDSDKRLLMWMLERKQQYETAIDKATKSSRDCAWAPFCEGPTNVCGGFTQNKCKNKDDVQKKLKGNWQQVMKEHKKKRAADSLKLRREKKRQEKMISKVESEKKQPSTEDVAERKKRLQHAMEYADNIKKELSQIMHSFD